MFDTLIRVLRLGCSYAAVVDTTCSASKVRNRREEWITAGAVRCSPGSHERMAECHGGLAPASVSSRSCVGGGFVTDWRHLAGRDFARTLRFLAAGGLFHREVVRPELCGQSDCVGPGGRGCSRDQFARTDVMGDQPGGRQDLRAMDGWLTVRALIRLVQVRMVRAAAVSRRRAAGA